VKRGHQRARSTLRAAVLAAVLLAGLPVRRSQVRAIVATAGGIAFEQPELLLSDGTPSNSGSRFSVGDVRAADLNGDGLPDVVAAVHWSGAATSAEYSSLAVRRNNGDGTFEDMTLTPTTAGNVDPFALNVGDVDGDGDADVVVNHPSARRLTVHHNRGDGVFDTTVEVFTDHRPHDFALGDVTGDGVPALVVINPLERVLQVFAGTGTSGFGAPVDHAGLEGNRTAVALGDVALHRLPLRERLVRRDGREVRFAPSVEVDVLSFERDATEATMRLRTSPAAAIETARRALMRYDGDLLPADFRDTVTSARRASDPGSRSSRTRRPTPPPRSRSSRTRSASSGGRSRSSQRRSTAPSAWPGS